MSILITQPPFLFIIICSRFLSILELLTEGFRNIFIKGLKCNHYVGSVFNCLLIRASLQSILWLYKLKALKAIAGSARYIFPGILGSSLKLSENNLENPKINDYTNSCELPLCFVITGSSVQTRRHTNSKTNHWVERRN